MHDAPVATLIDAVIEARGELNVGELTARGLTATRVPLDEVARACGVGSVLFFDPAGVTHVPGDTTTVPAPNAIRIGPLDV